MAPHERLIYELPYGPPCPKACHGFTLSQVDVLQYLYDLLRPNALDLDCPGVDGVRFVGLQEAPHVSANPLAHGGALVAREQGGKTADVVAVLLHALLVDGLTIRTLGRQVKPRLCLEGDQSLDRKDSDATCRCSVFDEQFVVLLVK